MWLLGLVEISASAANVAPGTEWRDVAVMQRLLGKRKGKPTIISLGGLATASAADLPVKARPIVVDPSYNWTGFYVGLNGGYAQGLETGDIVATSGGLAIPPAVAAGTIPTFLGIRAHGGFAGVQMGYNWQSGRMVLGVEGDFQGGGIKDSLVLTHAAIPGFFATMHTASTQLDTFGTLRGRIGFAWNQVLL
jgi:outer membrane immunogenic protein